MYVVRSQSRESTTLLLSLLYKYRIYVLLMLMFEKDYAKRNHCVRLLGIVDKEWKNSAINNLCVRRFHVKTPKI